MALPIEVVLPVVAGMAAAIGVLWKWGYNRAKKVDELQDLRLAEVKEYERSLATLRDRLRQKKGGDPS